MTFQGFPTSNIIKHITYISFRFAKTKWAEKNLARDGGKHRQTDRQAHHTVGIMKLTKRVGVSPPPPQ